MESFKILLGILGAAILAALIFYFNHLYLQEVTIMSTPGRRKALKALARRKKANLRRVAEGKKPIVDGKKVSAKSIGLTKKKAKERLAAQRKKKKS